MMLMRMRMMMWVDRAKVFGLARRISYRTRFAPSPTGSMHLGGLRTALFNYLIARQTGGSFLLRIEDTDRARTVPGAVGELMEVLEWAGIRADETPLQQSGRLVIYQAHVERLLADGHAYRCYCSKERLEALRESSTHKRYDQLCRNASGHREGPFVVRLKAPAQGQTAFVDRVFGRIAVPSHSLDDAVLLKADGFPTYHLANVVDDHASAVNLVMRGQEWLPSTPLHVLLYEAFGWERPTFAHLPLLVKADGTKLSKRHGDANVGWYREQLAVLPEALLNFVALLGWNPPSGADEVMTMAELTKAFSLAALNKAESRVNPDKLLWFNKKHLGRKTAEPMELAKLVTELKARATEQFKNPFHPKVFSDSYLRDAILLIKDRIHTIKDIPTLCPYFFETPPLVASTLDEAVVSFLSDQITSGTSIGDALHRLKGQFPSRPPSSLMLSARLAITNSKVGASLVDTCALLGRDEVLLRLHNRLQSIKRVQS
jgi:glutamyl-tRNA synthetase